MIVLVYDYQKTNWFKSNCPNILSFFIFNIYLWIRGQTHPSAYRWHVQKLVFYFHCVGQLRSSDLLASNYTQSHLAAPSLSLVVFETMSCQFRLALNPPHSPRRLQTNNHDHPSLLKTGLTRPGFKSFKI